MHWNLPTPRLRSRWICALLVSAPLLACHGAHSDKAFHFLVVSLGHVDPVDLAMLDPKRHPNLVQFLATSTEYSAFQAMGHGDLCNVASMWTGLACSEHGAGETEGAWSPLAERFTALPEYLIEHHYNPGAVVPAEAPFDPEWGLQQGFREYESIPGQATELAALAVDWIEHHTKQPFFLWVELPASQDGAALDFDGLDAALGSLLRCMGAQGLLHQACIVVTASSPRRPDGDLRVPLQIKAPLQTKREVDARPLEQLHLPALLLQHAALPVAAVRPGAFLSHPLPAPLPTTAIGTAAEIVPPTRE